MEPEDDDKADPIAEVRITSAEVVTTQSKVLQGNIKLVLWAASVLVVIAIVGAVLSFRLQDSVDHLEDKTVTLTQETNRGRDAAIEARDTLKDILENLENREETDDGVNNEAIRDALQAIHRIEQELCNGVCGP